MNRKEFFSKYEPLRSAKKGYWGMQVVNVLDGTFEFAFGTIFTIFLTVNLGLTDEQVGYAIAIIGVISMITFLLIGPAIDKLGMKKTLLFGLGGMLVFRTLLAILAFTPVFPFRVLILLTVYFLSGVPISMINICYRIGNQRFVRGDEKSQKASFSGWYVIMNFGAVFGSLLVDFVHKGLHLPEHWILVFGVATTLLSLAAALLMIIPCGFYDEENSIAAIKTHSESISTAPRENAKSKWNMARLSEIVLNVCSSLKHYYDEVICAPAFKRMLAALTLLLGVRMIFIYTAYLTPKYIYRVIGQDAWLGTINSINPFLIIVGVLLLIPITENWDTFKTLGWGSLFGGCSLIPLVIPWYYYSSDIVTAYYIMNGTFMLFLALGEMFWSPRLEQYITSVAPRGQLAIYSGFASLPMFLAKTATGFYSGIMLAKWCPEFIAQNVPIQKVLITQSLPYWQTPEAMWLILAIPAIVGPIIMLFLKDWFTVGMKQKV